MTPRRIYIMRVLGNVVSKHDFILVCMGPTEEQFWYDARDYVKKKFPGWELVETVAV